MNGQQKTQLIESSEKLPLGWVRRRISDIAVTQSGGTPSTAKREYWDGGDVPWINSGALKDRTINTPSVLITTLGLENSSAQIFPRRTVVIALTGATTGRVGLLEIECSTNQSVTGIFPSEAFVAEFLFYFLRSARDQILNLSIGSAQPHINKRIVDEFIVPVAPLPEQRRIVAKLEKLLGQVETCQKRLAKLSLLLKRFRQAVLAAACSGRLTTDWRKENPYIETTFALLNRLNISPDNYDIDDLPTTWTKCPLNLLADLITKGASPKWQGIEYVSEGILFVTSENVGWGEMLFNRKKYVELSINEIQPRSALKKGDLLTNIVGASIGRSAIYELNEKANVNQAVALIRLKKEIDKRYILYVLNSPSMVDHIHKQEVDVARANVSLRDVRNFMIPLPPLPEQKEIVRRVENLFALAGQIEGRLAKAQAQVNALMPSLLARAFRGELVPQDPNDEPASVLMERIKEIRQKKANQEKRIESK